MLYLPFARERRLWLPSPFIRGAGQINGTANSLGSVGNAAAGAAQNLTVTSTVSIGTDVFAAYSWQTTVGTDTCTFTDSASNTWTTDITAINASGKAISIGHMRTTTGLTGGTSTITATLSTSRSVKQLAAFMYVTADALVHPIATDGTFSNTSVIATTTIPITGAAPTNIPDYVIAAYANTAAAARTGTPSAGFTELFDFAVNSSDSMQVNIASPLTKDTTTVISPTETISSTFNVGVGAMVFYKASLLTGCSLGGDRIMAPMRAAVR